MTMQGRPELGRRTRWNSDLVLDLCSRARLHSTHARPELHRDNCSGACGVCAGEGESTTRSNLSLNTPAESSTSDVLHVSLSLLTLAIQSIIFIMLGISRIFRVSFPPLPDGAGWRNYYILKVWYELVGSIVVDSVVFGVGQGVFTLSCVAKR